MRRALSRRLVGVVAGTAMTVLASASLWIRPAETCEREPRIASARLVRFPVDLVAGDARAATRARTEVSGRVVDASGQAVPGVLVVPRPIDGSRGDPLGGGVLTDRSGQFQFRGLAPGQYWFIAIHGAYPFGSTPALPVADHLEVAITLDATAPQT